METRENNGIGTSRPHGELPMSFECLLRTFEVRVGGFGRVAAAITNHPARHGVNVVVLDTSTEMLMAPGPVTDVSKRRGGSLAMLRNPLSVTAPAVETAIRTA